jgi:hypothetical protein
MNRSSIRFACGIILVAAIALCGCSTVPQQKSADAILRGKSLDDAEHYSLALNTCPITRAAEIAWADFIAHSSSVNVDHCKSSMQNPNL